ncbi:DUF3923 family protein [Companilactobacillus furfuricola]|uniref:DUF3923 family protein n=1 Tax=Companilactobacillus furfuricola TaxID=1462575 RepID=UPI000F77C3AD|nr:DUF3923 family protein [Companilactobacillus furfuricola]
MKMKIWWIVNILWIILFAAMGIFVIVRKYDAAGILQTNQLKFATLAMLAVLLLFVGLCQALVLYFIKRSNQAKSKK